MKLRRDQLYVHKYATNKNLRELCQHQSSLNLPVNSFLSGGLVEKNKYPSHPTLSRRLLIFLPNLFLNKELVKAH